MQYLIIGVVVLGAWYFWPNDEWSGYFYPNRNDLTQHVETGVFKTLEECRDVTTAYGDDRGIPASKYDYECGLNCEPKDGFNVCEETLD